MKPQISSIGAWKIWTVAIAVAVTIGMAGNVQAAAAQNQIAVRDQDLNSG